MTSFLKIFFGIFFCCLLNACNTDSMTRKTIKDVIRKDSLNIDSLSSVKSPKNRLGSYLHLEGTIKDIPIVMELSYKKPPKHWDWENRDGYYEGYYYYTKYNEPLSVFQQRDTVETFVLTEQYAFNEANKFIGEMDSLGNFSGTWKDGYRGTTFPFQLEYKISDGVVEFENYSFSDSSKVKIEMKDKPQAGYSLHALWPTNLTGTKDVFLKKEFLKIMTEDTLSNLVKTPVDAFAKGKTTYFLDYHTEIEDLAAHDPEFIDASNNWDFQLDMTVSWNAANLLCIESSFYEYSGGAHGNYGATFHCYDLLIPRKITQKDIFKPNFEKTVMASLKKSAKRTFDSEGDDYTALDAIEMNALIPNGNFFITGGGIGYNFQPYEVGPYAIGEIRLFIPKEELMEVLREEFKARMKW